MNRLAAILRIRHGYADHRIIELPQDRQQVCDPARLALQRLPGGHFFIHGSQDQVLAALGRQLQQSL